LFQGGHLEDLQQRADLSAADRFVLGEQVRDYEHALKQLKSARAELKRFAQQDSAAEQMQREILRSAPGVGEVVSEVVLAEIGDAARFRSLKDATAYAGLVPGKHESDTKRKDLPITKQGSALLRWAMVEAAWVAVAQSARWRGVYEALKKRRQSKRAIIAVARRLLAVLVSMLKSGTKYRWSLAELKEREAQRALRQQRRRAKEAQEVVAVE